MAKTPKTKNFPQVLYAQYETDDVAGVSYLVAHEDLTGAAEIGKTVRIGVYKLVRTEEIEAMITSRAVR